MCWFLLWALLAGSTPSSHRFISASERHYIESSVAVCESEKRDIPWRLLLLSPCVWAIAVAHFCNNWGVYTLLTCMPTYLANIGILPGTNVSKLVLCIVTCTDQSLYRLLCSMEYTLVCHMQ